MATQLKSGEPTTESKASMVTLLAANGFPVTAAIRLILTR